MAARYVAIYILWVVDRDECMIGTTISPNEKPAQHQFYHAEETDYLLLWTPGQEIADRLIAQVRHEAKPFMTRPGEVHYQIPHERMRKAVERAAELNGVGLFSTEERTRRHVVAATKYVEGLKSLEVQRGKRAERKASAEVVLLSDRRKP